MTFAVWALLLGALSITMALSGSPVRSERRPGVAGVAFPEARAGRRGAHAGSHRKVRAARSEVVTALRRRTRRDYPPAS